MIRTPDRESVKREYLRAKAHYQRLGVPDNIKLVTYAEGVTPLGDSETLAVVQESLGLRQPPVITPHEGPPNVEAIRERIAARQKQQIGELTRHTQRLMHLSDKAVTSTGRGRTVRRWLSGKRLRKRTGPRSTMS